MKYLIAGAALLASACSSGTPAPENPTTPVTAPVSNCLLHSPSDVQMWINAMPGPNDNPTLLSTFKITAPTPGYAFDLQVLEVRESFPPQYVFELVATPPGGIVTQVETVEEVRLELPKFDYETIASAMVKCGKTTLFTVESVDTVY